MGDIKYYQLAKGEEMPDEFCVVRDVDGEPNEYMFYVPETENAKLWEQYKTVLADYRSEVAKLRKACSELLKMAERHDTEWLHWPEMHEELRELGVEVE